MIQNMTNGEGKDALMKGWMEHSRRIPVPAGGLLVWNSRTTHQGELGAPFSLSLSLCLSLSLSLSLSLPLLLPLLLPLALPLSIHIHSHFSSTHQDGREVHGWLSLCVGSR